MIAVIEIKEVQEKSQACVGCGQKHDLKYISIGTGLSTAIQVALCVDCRRRLRILLSLDG